MAVLVGELAVPCYLQTAIAGAMLVLGYYRIDIDREAVLIGSICCNINWVNSVRPGKEQR